MDTEAPYGSPTNAVQCQEAMIPVSEVLQQIAGKWTIFIIGQLAHGPRRFSELKRAIEGVSQKMLTASLREMEENGLVKRTVTPTIPPRVDYELTDVGLELRQPLQVISQWAFVNRARIASARQSYASAHGGRQ